MGSARVVASIALLLAVGPLLLLAPWWPLPTLVVVLLLLLTVAALLLLFFAAYKWSSKRQADWTATTEPREPTVSWQVGRWDTDARHAYVANVGEATAYEVNIMASDRVLGTAQSVPPYSADRLSSSSEPPCYVNFCVHERIKRRISSGVDGATRSAQGQYGWS